MQKAFRNVLVIAIIGVIIFGVFSYKWEWQYTETTFLFTVCREIG